MFGVAYGPGSLAFVKRNPRILDFIELPFELLRHDPSTASARELLPVVLHCASMSLAGFVPPSAETLQAISKQAELLGTPWIGEHLAFISADPLETGAALHEPTTLTYTVCPQLSEEVVGVVCDNIKTCQTQVDVPLIVENSPQYFRVPGSTMSIVDFVIEVHRRCEVGMLLDLTHFMISSMNAGFDPHEEILRLPLENMVEMHISGLDVQSELAWDNHATLADESIFSLAQTVLRNRSPHAITFEYNWSPDLPDHMFVEQIARLRTMHN